MKIFVFGSSIVSSYWNGAATYYRGVYKYLARRGHQITFAEPDAYERQKHRDEGDFSFVRSLIYKPTEDIDAMLESALDADLIIKHSGLGVDDTILEYRVAELSNLKATFFWDVDSPATIVRIQTNPTDPFRTVIPLYDAVLSYGGGPASRDGYLSFGAQAYYNIYNGLDPDTHYTTSSDPSFACDAVFLGNRLPDREIRVAELFFRAAELAPEMSFLLGGEGWGDYPIPSNVRWIGHVSSKDHNRINCSAGMVMNINRCSMASFGYSPPTRVFEAAGAGACILCDDWPGINECFEPDREILLVRCAEDVVDALRRYSEADRKRIGLAAHTRALQEHTYAQRAAQVEAAFIECKERRNQIQKVKCA